MGASRTIRIPGFAGLRAFVHWTLGTQGASGAAQTVVTGDRGRGGSLRGSEQHAGPGDGVVAGSLSREGNEAEGTHPRRAAGAKGTMKILLIEDSESYATLVSRYLSGLVDEVHVASTWKEAELMLSGMDLIWFDLFLPDMEPPDTFVRVAEVRSRVNDVVIIVVSGFMDERVKQQAIRSGADLAVEKHDASTPMQIASLVLLAITYAERRGANISQILERSIQFMTTNFPEHPLPA